MEISGETTIVGHKIELTSDRSNLRAIIIAKDYYYKKAKGTSEEELALLNLLRLIDFNLNAFEKLSNREPITLFSEFITRSKRFIEIGSYKFNLKAGDTVIDKFTDQELEFVKIGKDYKVVTKCSNNKTWNYSINDIRPKIKSQSAHA